MSCMTCKHIELMTTTEVARALRVDSSTVRRWATNGAITSVRLPNGTIRIPREVVDQMLTPDAPLKSATA